MRQLSALERLESIRRAASINAIAARALGRDEQERAWLDILALADYENDA